MLDGSQCFLVTGCDNRADDGVVVAEAAADAHPPTTAIPVVKAEEPAAPEAKSRNGMVNEEARYGESLLREMLGAEPMQDPKAGGR